MEELSLNNICDGYVKEKIDEELKKICENLLDRRMDEKAKRELNIKVLFLPEKNNPDNIISAVTVSSKLAPEIIGTQFSLEQDENGIKMYEYSKGQINGQLTFRDVEMDMNPPELEVL